MKTLFTLIVLFAACMANAQGCYDCTSIGSQGTMCNSGGAEGYAKCLTSSFKCNSGPRGVCYRCILYPPYEYCVYGATPTVTQAQSHPPSVETMKLIPWIVDENIVETLSSLSSVPGIDKQLRLIQTLQLKDGINQDGFLIVFTEPETVRWVVRLQSEEIDGVRERQTINVFKAPNQKNMKTKDIIDGITGKKVETIVFEDDHWTWTSGTKKQSGKVAPYTGPRAQTQNKCNKAKPS